MSTPQPEIPQILPPLIPQEVLKPDLYTGDVAAAISQALREPSPLAVMRYSGTSALMAEMLGMRGFMSPKLWRHYRLDHQDFATMRRIVDAIERVDILGIHISGPRAIQVQASVLGALRAWRIEPTDFDLADVYLMYYLIIKGYLWNWAESRILIINENASEIAPLLRAGKYSPMVAQYTVNAPPMNVVGSVDLAEYEIDAAIERAATHNVDLVLIGAGARKFPIGTELAQRTGAVVLDMGHGLNALVEGVKPGNRREDEPGPTEIWGVSRPHEFHVAEKAAQEELV